jgi:hypothetical protein
MAVESGLTQSPSTTVTNNTTTEDLEHNELAKWRVATAIQVSSLFYPMRSQF